MPKSAAQTKDAPSQQVAEAVAAGAVNGPGAPVDLEAALDEITPVNLEAPTIIPAAETEAVTEEDGITAWHTGKKITALWCNSSNRNAYASVEGIGWRRLANTNDGAHLSLTMLAAHAEQTGANCNIRIESDNMIHEIYVW